MIAPPLFKTGIFSSKYLNLREIEQQMKDTFAKMNDFGKTLAPGQADDKFIGVAIVVLET
jgi:hypothetical protein